MRQLLHALRREASGSVLVEFALLAPAFIMLLIGVLQVGVYLQNYNAIRTLAADVSRYAMIQYQMTDAERGGPEPDAGDIEDKAYDSIATSSGANLDSSRLTITVVEEPTSTIADMTEMTITVSYDSPEFLPFLDSLVSMSYARPVFLSGV